VRAPHGRILWRLDGDSVGCPARQPCGGEPGRARHDRARSHGRGRLRVSANAFWSPRSGWATRLYHKSRDGFRAASARRGTLPGTPTGAGAPPVHGNPGARTGRRGQNRDPGEAVQPCNRCNVSPGESFNTVEAQCMHVLCRRGSVALGGRTGLPWHYSLGRSQFGRAVAGATKGRRCEPGVILQATGGRTRHRHPAVHRNTRGRG
jgi:hypothetical protein